MLQRKAPGDRTCHGGGPTTEIDAVEGEIKTEYGKAKGWSGWREGGVGQRTTFEKHQKAKDVCVSFKRCLSWTGEQSKTRWSRDSGRACHGVPYPPRPPPSVCLRVNLLGTSRACTGPSRP